MDVFSYTQTVSRNFIVKSFSKAGANYVVEISTGETCDLAKGLELSIEDSKFY